MRVEETAAVILAAGLSRRFGEDDKLTADLRGRPLGAAAAETVRSLPFQTIFAVVPAGRRPLASVFEDYGAAVLENPAPEAGQGVSLALAAAAAEKTESLGLLVALADMPFVQARHLQLLCESIGPAHAAVSLSGGRRQPPALFTRKTFPALARLSGDAGARGLLKTLASVAEVPLPAQDAMDIDTEADLKAALDLETTAP